MTTGCEHYKRFCKILTPCCTKPYSCHICHDDKENHSLNRHLIQELICDVCNHVQDPKSKCDNCGTVFGIYSCLYCFVFDNDLKGQFHCFECGLCRVGGEANYFHCKMCNMCFALRLRANHKCVENCAGGNCPLCGEGLHSSRKELHVPTCGHLLHTECHNTLVSNNYKKCTICNLKTN
ncbi:hypothetical protein PPYR_14536 [Photinus pyralis]|uniref:CHY-type domain-containing protein n=1 Tax=Photinus pyralis TaxID=7054 RepID=A0A5N4A5J1_PHOPY|nr:RING finger and CHY zinc finger domain-containing protein 1-like [Photinus pyralis]KAB0792577.1 hypothetical protein PPYR_14536 [Photinus pyralis]